MGFKAKLHSTLADLGISGIHAGGLFSTANYPALLSAVSVAPGAIQPADTATQYMAPLPLPFQGTFTQVIFRCSTAPSALQTFRVGLYASKINASGALVPAGLVADFGTVAFSTTGNKIINFPSNLTLAPGIYWLAIKAEDIPATPAILQTWGTATIAFALGTSFGSTYSSSNGFTIGGRAPGPFVDPFPTGGFGTANQSQYPAVVIQGA